MVPCKFFDLQAFCQKNKKDYFQKELGVTLKFILEKVFSTFLTYSFAHNYVFKSHLPYGVGELW